MGRVLVLASLIIANGPAPAHAAQGRLIRAGLRVVPDAGSTEIAVQMEYVLRPAGDTVVPLSVVLFDSTSITGLALAVNGRSVTLEGLSGDGLSYQSGTVRLSPSNAALDSLPFRVLYTVHPRGVADRERIQVPVVAVTWPPVEASPGTFVATLLMPGGYSAFDPLPSVLREISNEGSARAYEASLQVVPALFSFRMTEGRAPRFGLAGLLDTGVLVLLAVFTWIGWRHFRQGD
jgi:hypothetical protein